MHGAFAFKHASTLEMEKLSKLKSKLFAHEAVEYEIDCRVNECQNIPNFCPCVVAFLEELFSVDTGEESHDTLWELGEEKQAENGNQELARAVRTLS